MIVDTGKIAPLNPSVFHFAPFDNSGKLIHSELDMLAEKNIEIDLSFLQTGIYVMKIIGESNSKSLKLIKE